MAQFGPYLAPDPIEECIIVATKDKEGDIILAKNRDRMYNPKFKVVHMVKNGTEIAFWYDEDTGWAEGMNEHGIGIVNTALMVDFDEKEKKIAKKTGTKSEDGERIIEALGKDNIEDALKAAKIFKGGVKGHTFISDTKGNSYKIEATKNHKPKQKEINLDNVTVRTNHGHDHHDAGYTKGKDYDSSIDRKDQAEDVIYSNTHSATELLNLLKKQKYKKDHPNNMRRDTKKMSTTCQLALNLTKKEMLVHWFESKSEFTVIDNRLPRDYKAKIKITVKKIDI